MHKDNMDKVYYIAFVVFAILCFGVAMSFPYFSSKMNANSGFEKTKASNSSSNTSVSSKTKKETNPQKSNNTNSNSTKKSNTNNSKSNKSTSTTNNNKKNNSTSSNTNNNTNSSSTDITNSSIDNTSTSNDTNTHNTNTSVNDSTNSNTNTSTNNNTNSSVNNNTNTNTNTNTNANTNSNTNANNNANTNANTNTNTNTNANANTNTNTNNNSTIDVTGISLNRTSYSLIIGNSVSLTASVSPSNATDKTVTWSSSNVNVATVNNGKVVAASQGTATITATTSNGKTATCVISVQDRNKIHYISNGSTFKVPTDKSKGASPANTILLESNGHYALIDTGLQNNNSLNSGHSTLVVNYLKKVGVTKLDFILITHDHYDHIGGLNEILDSIPTDTVYIKPYYSHDGKGSGDETTRTLYAKILKKYFGSSFSCDSNCIKNPDTYRKALKVVDGLYGMKRTKVGNLKMTSTLYKINANAEGKVLTLGSMTVKLYNTTNLSYHSACYGTSSTQFDENSNSIISYIQMGNRTALIAGDLEPISKTCYNKIYGTCSSSKCSIMNYITKKIKNGNTLNVDLLELSHHGYSSCDMSTTIRNFINPKKIVIPNWSQKIQYYYSSSGPYSGGSPCKSKYFNTQYYNSNHYYVGSNNVVFDFTDDAFNVYNN